MSTGGTTDGRTLKTYLQVISDGVRQRMQRDKRVYVSRRGRRRLRWRLQGHAGLPGRVRPRRVIDAPALRNGDRRQAAPAAAIMGRRPVAEMESPISRALGPPGHRRREAVYRAGTAAPIVVRLPSGGGFSGGPFHSQNRESSFAHIPGLKIVCPATPADAKGLLISAIEDANPVLYFEHKHLYRRIKDEVPDERYTIPFGQARIHREGARTSRGVTWARWSTRPTRRRRSSSPRTACPRSRDHRPAHDHPVGSRGGAKSVGRPRRRSSSTRRRVWPFRRRDLGDNHRGGVREWHARSSGSPHPTRRCRSPPPLEKAFLPQVEDVVAGLRTRPRTRNEMAT